MRLRKRLLLLPCLLASCKTPPAEIVTLARPSPHPLATWPWPAVQPTEVHPGVTRWFATSPDRTTAELFRFDFKANPRLAFKIYDQDQDDATPGDNTVDFFDRSVAHVTKDLNEQGKGKVIAAWNGLFFGYDRSVGSPPYGWAKHIGPVVLNGKVLYNVGRHRWTFGVKQRADGPKFKVLLMPSKEELAKEFDYAADGAQCLVNEGKGLRLEPYPSTPAQIMRPGKIPTADEAGHIPGVDHMKTSRTSMGWSRDSSEFYLLVVSEPDTENASKAALKQGTEDQTGWTLDDL